MGVLNKTNLMGNCEGEGNASNFRCLPVARTNVDRHGHSRVAVVISCNRDRSYFWHYFVSGGDIDFGFAEFRFDGTVHVRCAELFNEEWEQRKPV